MQLDCVAICRDLPAIRPLGTICVCESWFPAHLLRSQVFGSALYPQSSVDLQPLWTEKAIRAPSTASPANNKWFNKIKIIELLYKYENNNSLLSSIEFFNVSKYSIV
ncbi:hypothetical protein CEXT_259431 [Caerostris extrusa]|uniref:Uncharacterized protein n=1 Tax=Caerostris extrusa TaxID=172846 RepID=A0AAV4TS47_CAEEX|nr:hypothetical protein CEXT_259431 [Caerostris extrusa]